MSTIPINLHRLIRPACHLVPGWLDMFKFLHCFSEPFEAEFSCLKQSSTTILSIVLHLSPSKSNLQPYGAGLAGFVQGVHTGTKALAQVALVEATIPCTSPRRVRPSRSPIQSNPIQPQLKRKNVFSPSTLIFAVI